jgi:cytoskeletal protein CcmA (bactofilin family)
MNESDKKNIINSIIGEGSELKGEFKVKGTLRIDGVFAGEILTDGTIIVSKTGYVKTDLKGGTIIIGGTVEGNVYATKQVTLLKTAKLKGDIITPSLIAEEGVKFDGHCIINKGDKNFFDAFQKKKK